MGDQVNLFRLSEAELVKVVRQRAYLAARSLRLRLRCREEDYNALMRVRAACNERGLPGLFTEAYEAGLKDDREDAEPCAG